jgi:hypothetical protein
MAKQTNGKTSPRVKSRGVAKKSQQNPVHHRRGARSARDLGQIKQPTSPMPAQHQEKLGGETTAG